MFAECSGALPSVAFCGTAHEKEDHPKDTYIFLMLYNINLSILFEVLVLQFYNVIMLILLGLLDHQ